VTEILNQFRDEELPPSTVDISQAVRAGRRRRRIGTGLVAGGVAIALAVAGATAPIWLSPRPSPVPPAAPMCDSPVPAQPSMPAWEQFCPLSYEIDASGVTGYKVKTSVTSTYWQFVELDTGNRRVSVYLYAGGGEPHYLDAGQAAPFDPGAGEPADPIGNAPAYWLPPDKLDPSGDPAQGLAWQWTPGAWVIVLASAPEQDPSTVDPAELRAIATQVAPQLELGVGTPVTSPFSLPVPEGLDPAFTVMRWASDFGEQFATGFSIGFDAVGTAEPTHPLRDYVPAFAVEASPFSTRDKRPATATEYPEDLGYPAYQAVLTPGSQVADVLLVYDFFGFGMQIGPVNMPGASTGAERLSLAADLFRTITVYPGAADREEAWGSPIAP